MTTNRMSLAASPRHSADRRSTSPARPPFKLDRLRNRSAMPPGTTEPLPPQLVQRLPRGALVVAAAAAAAAVVVIIVPAAAASPAAPAAVRAASDEPTLGLPCRYNVTSTSPYSVRTHVNHRRPLTKSQDVAHASELEFHCPIQRFYRLVGPTAVRCVDGHFDERPPHCEPVLLSNRLTALVDTEYILGPGGDYVVFPGSQVRMSCYHALSRSYRPSWQWVGTVDSVFIEERVSFGQVTVAVKFEARNDTNATFICSDTTDDIHVRVVSRPLHCPPIRRSTGLRVVQTSWLRADFSCAPGSILLGDSSANCMQYRQWDSEAPICAYAGCRRRRIEADGSHDGGVLLPCQLGELSADVMAHAGSSRLRARDVVPHGGIVRFHCHDVGKARLIGQAETRCVNGDWSAPAPLCAVPERSALKGVILDFDFSYRLGEAANTLYVDPKSDLVLKCISPAKYMPTFNYTVVEEYSPVFIIHADAEDSTAVAKVLSFNTGPKFEAEFFCATNDSDPVTETRSIRVVTREPRCGPFDAREGLRYRIEGDVAVFGCKSPGRLLGSPVLKCEEGSWNGAQPLCVFQERCEGWSEDLSAVPASALNQSRRPAEGQEESPPSRQQQRQQPEGNAGQSEAIASLREFVVRESAVVRDMITNYNQFDQQTLDVAMPPVTAGGAGAGGSGSGRGNAANRKPAKPRPLKVATSHSNANEENDEKDDDDDDDDNDDDDDDDASDDDEDIQNLLDEAEKENDIESDKDDADGDENHPPALPRQLNPIDPVSSTPSPLPLRCASQTGLFAHPIDCRLFVLCVDGIAQEMRCPHGLIFSPSKRLCRAADDDTGCYAV